MAATICAEEHTESSNVTDAEPNSTEHSETPDTAVSASRRDFTQCPQFIPLIVICSFAMIGSLPYAAPSVPGF